MLAEIERLRSEDASGAQSYNPVVDTAARKDLLGRESFAHELSNMLHKTRRTQRDQNEKLNEEREAAGKPAGIKGDGFAVHLHGPWGAGKTSILYMMQDYLSDKDREEGDRWAVVQFQRLAPRASPPALVADD